MLIHLVCASVPAAELKLIVASALTVIVPLAVAFTHGPAVVIV